MVDDEEILQSSPSTAVLETVQADFPRDEEELAERRELLNPHNPAATTTLSQGESYQDMVYRMLKWPLFAVFFMLLLLDLWLYFILRQMVNMYEMLFGRFRDNRRVRRLKDKMTKAITYSEWKSSAMALDVELGNQRWVHDAASTLYNFRLITQLTTSMRQYRETLTQNPHDLDTLKHLKKILLEGSLRHNVGGIESITLYSHTYYGTKQAIQEFIEESERCLLLIERVGLALVGADALYTFFKKAAASYGRSVLCLSGGGSSGYYHLGVIRILGRAQLLPQVICGTSAGAAIAAYVCTRTDKELARDLHYDDESSQLDKELCSNLAEAFGFTKESWWPWMKRLFQHGHLMDVHEATECLQHMCHGDFTFEEAYQRTGRILNITITTDDEASPPQILNYQTTPDVIIHTAVLASASIPGLLPSVTLLRKRKSIVFSGDLVDARNNKTNNNNHKITGNNNKGPRLSPETVIEEATSPREPFEWLGSRWRDGSFVIDVPVEHLRPMFNIKFSLVSQVNPGAALFFFDSRGRPGQPHGHRRGRGYRAGFVTTFLEAALKLDMKRHLELLGTLQLMPKFLKQDWSLLLLQRRDGTATILPSAEIYDLTHLFSSPTPTSMQLYVLKGQRATWPILKMFDNRLRIEKILTRNLVHLKTQKTTTNTPATSPTTTTSSRK